MPLKYGDSVILIQKSPDGTLRRVNAIVLESRTQPPNATRPQGLRNSQGALLAEGEYLDVHFPDPSLVADGRVLKTRAPEVIFRPAYSVPPWKDGAWIGWQYGSTTPCPPSPLPSAADLDAVAAEQTVVAATGSKGSSWRTTKK
jgi:hypothetical protein